MRDNGTRVLLDYFKASGKWYGAGQYTSRSTFFHDVKHEVWDMCARHSLPGLHLSYVPATVLIRALGEHCLVPGSGSQASASARGSDTATLQKRVADLEAANVRFARNQTDSDIVRRNQELQAENTKLRELLEKVDDKWADECCCFRVHEFGRCQKCKFRTRIKQALGEE